MFHLILVAMCYGSAVMLANGFLISNHVHFSSSVEKSAVIASFQSSTSAGVSLSNAFSSVHPSGDRKAEQFDILLLIVWIFPQRSGG